MRTPFDFKAISREAQDAMDAAGIQHTDTEAMFSRNVRVSTDVEDEYNQPSEYRYRSHRRNFVYDLSQEILDVEVK